MSKSGLQALLTAPFSPSRACTFRQWSITRSTRSAALVLAQRYGVYAQEAASTTAATTLLAIFTISGALAIASTL
jgi:predicted permease